MPDDLDYAKFQLDAVKAHAEIQVNYLKAIADYNFRMMEVLEKQQKISQAVDKQKMLREAYVLFRAAVKDAQKRARKAEKAVGKIEKFKRKSEMLYLGETLPPSQVSVGWQGFRFMVNQLEGREKLKATSGIKVSSKHRTGDNFSKNRYPDKECDDAPGTVRTAYALANWCRKRSYVPRLDSPFIYKLQEIYDLIQVTYQKKIEQLNKKFEALLAEDLKLRKQNWENVAALQVKPK